MQNIKYLKIKNSQFIFLFSINLFFLFLFVVSILITKNLNVEAFCLTYNCSNVYLNSDVINNILINSNIVLPILSVVFSLLLLASGLKKKAFSFRTLLFGVVTTLSLGMFLIFQFSGLFQQRFFNSVSYAFGIIAISLASLWFLSFKYENREPVLSKAVTIYDIWAFSSLFLIFIGIYVSATNASSLCVGFPFCNDFTSLGLNGFLVLFHRIFTGFVTIITIIVLWETWRYYRHSNVMLVSITVGFALFVGQILIGAQQVLKSYPADLVIIHALSAAVFYVTLMVSVYSSKFEKRSENPEKQTIFNDRKRLADFVKLNKPIIVVLLLVTTFGGMVVGGGKIPGFELTIWTLLAGGLAAGGSSAINQYIDRDIDFSMQRTAKRPVPSGRLQPAEALALGIVEIIFAFFIYVSFVNLLSAILAMVGMVYYVFIYSLWLKHATVQNIVIGGGAGAIPPLVGWAAATGSLNIPSLFLFALVFLWTPPHFWALAIIRKNDYARANVPMMPVIMGEKKTRNQILYYTIQLVVLTLLMPIFKLGGILFLISAIILGFWILYTAWQVVKVEGNKVAYKMYRYSSMYLAFIFLALTIDVFI